MEDSGIIELYWSRNEKAIQECQKKYGKLFYRIAYNLLNCHEDSEECVSETYVRAWNSIPPARPASLKAYLGRIVRNLALHYLEKQNAGKRGGKNLLLSELSEMIPESTDVEGTVETRELTRFLAAWLDGLCLEERILFMRRYWFGESLKDIAPDMGTTANKLAGKLFRLREKLRGELEKEGVYL